jgi:hypothetical protein
MMKNPPICVYDATRAEYDRFGGVGISMTRQSKSPAGLLLPEHPVPVLLLRANDLRFGARRGSTIRNSPNGGGAGADGRCFH